MNSNPNHQPYGVKKRPRIESPLPSSPSLLPLSPLSPPCSFSSLSQLPLELSNHVIEYLPLASVLQYASTCKTIMTIDSIHESIQRRTTVLISMHLWDIDQKPNENNKLRKVPLYHQTYSYLHDTSTTDTSTRNDATTNNKTCHNWHKVPSVLSQLKCLVPTLNHSQHYLLSSINELISSLESIRSSSSSSSSSSIMVTRGKWKFSQSSTGTSASTRRYCLIAYSSYGTGRVVQYFRETFQLFASCFRMLIRFKPNWWGVWLAPNSCCLCWVVDLCLLTTVQGRVSYVALQPLINISTQFRFFQNHIVQREASRN